MRIISGIFKGKKILQPKDQKTRPLKDLTKESIFNIIEHSKKFKVELKNSIILDLFSGTGSFGIECLSRNAKKVIFVENYCGILPILKRNLSDLKTIDNFKIVESDIYKENFILDENIKFDIIFLDPPYKDKNLSVIFKNILNEKILNKNGLIILHRHKKEKDDFPSNFKIIEEKNYGISKIIFLSYWD